MDKFILAVRSEDAEMVPDVKHEAKAHTARSFMEETPARSA